MAELVNLRLVRKRKAKEAAEKTAAENRILSGRTKAEKQFDRQAKRRTARFLDDHRLGTRNAATEDEPGGK